MVGSQTPQLERQKKAFLEILRNNNRYFDYEDAIKKIKEKYGYKNLPTPRKLSTWAKTIDEIKFDKQKCKINGRTSKRMIYKIEE